MDWAMMMMAAMMKLTLTSAAVATAAVATVRLSMWTSHHLLMVYANWLVDYAVHEWWLEWQTGHGYVYYYCVHLVIDIYAVCVHYEFSVGYHLMQYDDWIETVTWLYLDCTCRCLHCTGMFHIHSMLMSDADARDYSSRPFVLNVANDNVDGADCKLVYIDFDLYMIQQQSIRIFWTNF